MESEIEIKARLAELGKALRGTKTDSRSYRIIMSEIDKLLGTEDRLPDPELDEQWERGHR
jgi:hypothetical protein